MKYESLESMVAPYLSTPFDSLPATVAARVLTTFQLFHWDECGEQRRQQIVKEYDYWNDPATEPVRAHYGNLVELIDHTKNEIRNWELIPAPLPTERLVKEQRLSALRDELEALEVLYEVPYPAPTLADTTLSGPPTIDYGMVATRQQLIDAFGAFTGMDDSWFKNLNDKPKLKAARKFTGQGGRNNAEPLFCPFEVMTWLVNPQRKTGRPLGSDKAWEKLEAVFPKVYNQFSVGDTRTD
jgi:hypothetical protein